jgi:hypothetical protein
MKEALRRTAAAICLMVNDDGFLESNFCWRHYVIRDYYIENGCDGDTDCLKLGLRSINELPKPAETWFNLHNGVQPADSYESRAESSFGFSYLALVKIWLMSFGNNTRISGANSLHFRLKPNNLFAWIYRRSLRTRFPYLPHGL